MDCWIDRTELAGHRPVHWTDPMAMWMNSTKDCIINLRWCLWCARFREIMLDAPWSSFDLAMSWILILRGTYLIIGFTMLESAYSLYRPLSGWLGLWAYGWICVASGLLQGVSVLWPQRPPFELRLLARLGTCFCMVMFTLNNLANAPPPIGAITHFVLSILSIWSVLRTSRSGG